PSHLLRLSATPLLLLLKVGSAGLVPNRGNGWRARNARHWRGCRYSRRGEGLVEAIALVLRTAVSSWILRLRLKWGWKSSGLWTASEWTGILAVAGTGFWMAESIRDIGVGGWVPRSSAARLARHGSVRSVLLVPRERSRPAVLLLRCRGPGGRLLHHWRICRLVDLRCKVRLRNVHDKLIPVGKVIVDYRLL